MSYPTPPPPQYTPSKRDGLQTLKDHEHLNLLAILYYIMGVAQLLIVTFLALSVGLVSAVASNAPGLAPSQNPQALRAMGAMISGFGTPLFLAAGIAAALTVYAGRCLQTAKNAGLIYVMAALQCLNVPLGTALGIFTFIVMSRPTVQSLFGGHANSTPPRGY